MIVFVVARWNSWGKLLILFTHSHFPWKAMACSSHISQYHFESINTARLISIVSKPILIVLVVVEIDVVFVKNMLGPKKI